MEEFQSQLVRDGMSQLNCFTVNLVYIETEFYQKICIKWTTKWKTKSWSNKSVKKLGVADTACDTGSILKR